MSKSLSLLYLGAYATVARLQHLKYGNPTAEQMPAPNQVPNVLEAAVRDGHLTTAQARKLAMALGRLAYGELGLTSGRVNDAIEKACGFGALQWDIKARLESRLCGHL